MPGLLAVVFRGNTHVVITENQPPHPVQRLRLTFAKEGAARYISHLDLARALERALNRAGLPIAYTQGFNRRPRLSLAAALPLGYTSEAEVADVWLTDMVLPADFLEQLQNCMPPGLRVKSARAVALIEPSVQQRMAESLFEVKFLEPVDHDTLKSRVEELMRAETVHHERSHRNSNKPQIVDLRPLIIDIDVTPGPGNQPRLFLRLVQTATQTGRPDDVLAALGFDPLDTHVHRIALRFADGDFHLV